MKLFFKKHQKLHIWLLVDLMLIALFLLMRNNRAAMNALTGYVTEPLKRAIGSVTYLVDFSVAEVLYITAILVGVVLIPWAIRVLMESRRKWQTLYRMVLGAVCAGLSIYVGMTLLWGVNYYADSFQEKSGIYARQASVAELEELTRMMAQGVIDIYDDVKRDENGLFAESREDIFAASAGIYACVYDEFPFLEQQDQPPKALVFSETVSRVNFTGFFFPFTAEANLNVHCPPLYLASTIVHEMAHLRGIASEQECNFLAVVASTASDEPAYRYAGWLLGYVYTSNALYRVNQEKWREIRQTIPEEVMRDLRRQSDYWAGYEGKVSQTASNAYDSFLKGYGDEDGIQSYGTVVDMLITYYLG